jgi:hypothetical protein
VQPRERMKLTIVLVAATACAQPYNDEPYPDYVPPPRDRCTSDAECQPSVCARDHACHAADDVRSVLTTWTIVGKPASATACARVPKLYIRFDTDLAVEAITFAPVPCELGQFLLDKAPGHSIQVELGGYDGLVINPNGGFGAQRKLIDASGAVAFDMQI